MGIDECNEYIAAFYKKEAMNNALVLAANIFCDRVEAHEIISKKSYKMFCLALCRIPKLEDAMAKSIAAQIEG